VVIQGAGYIAMEFAGIFNALGAQVTVVNRSNRILRGYDHDLTERLMAMTEKRGIEYRFDSPICGIEKLADGSLRVALDGHDPIEADVVLVATGRRPKTIGLGLEEAGVKLGANGEVIVDDYGETSVPSIHAVGDVTDRVQLTPVAIREGHAFADTVFGGKPRTTAYDAIPSAVFSQPPLAAVGLTEMQARDTGEIKVFTSDFRPMTNMFSTRSSAAFTSWSSMRRATRCWASI
jgi:glutathione reductase (NADPH)